jgi:predicted SAM-dependent methyltransferase
MPAPFMSEAAKVRELPEVMQYIRGKVLDYGCGADKIIPTAIGMDGRDLPGVDIVCPNLEDPSEFSKLFVEEFDTIFSSHFLEHTMNPREVVRYWHQMLIPNNGSHLILYLPDGRHYNHHNNPEHLWDINYDNFLFWFRRNFCGEGNNYLGNQLMKYFEIVDHKMDIGEDRYSFYVIAKAV